MNLHEALIELWNDGVIDSPPRTYSGRGMYGRQCLGVDLGSSSEMFSLAMSLARMGVECDDPTTDSMGRGIIAYWPQYEVDGIELPSDPDDEEGEDE